jgi:hypothetical protein
MFRAVAVLALSAAAAASSVIPLDQQTAGDPFKFNITHDDPHVRRWAAAAGAVPVVKSKMCVHVSPVVPGRHRAGPAGLEHVQAVW